MKKKKVKKNCTVAEIKKIIISLPEQFSNKNMWLDLYKREISGKFKQAHIDFFNTLSEIIEDEQKSVPENDIVE